MMVNFYFWFVNSIIFRWFRSKSLWKFTGEMFFIVSICLPSYNVIQLKIRENADICKAVARLMTYCCFAFCHIISIPPPPPPPQINWCDIAIELKLVSPHPLQNGCYAQSYAYNMFSAINDKSISLFSSMCKLLPWFTQLRTLVFKF